MASVFSDRIASAGVPCGMRFNSETVTHYAGGSGSGVAVLVIVTREKPVVDQSTGVATVQSLELSVPDSVACLKTDKWIVASVSYQTTWVRPAESGMILVGCKAISHEYRREGGELM